MPSRQILLFLDILRSKTDKSYRCQIPARTRTQASVCWLNTEKSMRLIDVDNVKVKQNKVL